MARARGRRGGARGLGNATVPSLLWRATEAASGNPGLQAILTRPILAGELAAAEAALDQIDVYRKTGAPPAEIQALIEAGTARDSENALTAFFQRAVVHDLPRRADRRTRRGSLRRRRLFSPDVPIPRAALGGGPALGVERPAAAVRACWRSGCSTTGDIDAIAACRRQSAGAAAGAGARRRRTGPASASRAAAIAARRNADGDFPAEPAGGRSRDRARRRARNPPLSRPPVFAGAVWLAHGPGATTRALGFRRALERFPKPCRRADFLRARHRVRGPLGEADCWAGCWISAAAQPAGGMRRSRSTPTSTCAG